MSDRLRASLNTLFEFTFGPASVSRFKRTQFLLLALVLLLGGVTWLNFFKVHNNRCFFQAVDWGIEQEYYEVIQEAYHTHRIPYHVSEPIQPIQPTQRFLAIPESLHPLAPQAPLLAFMTVKHFVMANVLLHYLVGFWGCLLLRKRFDFSPFAFLVLFLLFNFNGHILGHIAAGHKWNGYFYLPLFAAFVFDAVKQSAPVFETAVKIAVVNLFILLQGTLHPFAMCMIFLGLLFVFSKEARWTALFAMIFTAWLSVFRLLPAAMMTRRLQPDDFIYGYRSLTDFLNTIVKMDLYPKVIFPWEYNLYLSLIGFLFVFFFGVLLRFSRRAELVGTRFQGLGWPILLMTIFAFHDYWFQLIYGLPNLIHMADKIPNTERIPPRFMVLPLVFLTAIACVRMQRLYALFIRQRWLGLGALIGLAGMALLLGKHWQHWRLDSVEHTFESLVTTLVHPHIISLTDPAYIRTVNHSLVFSLSALLVMLSVWAWRRVRRRGAAHTIGSDRAAPWQPHTETPKEHTWRVRAWIGVACLIAGLCIVHEARAWFSTEGLWVAYYSGTQLRHHARWYKVEKELCRSFLEEPPVGWLGWSGFSSRWVGNLDVPKDADYIFYCQSIDGMRLYLDGQCVLDNWRDQTWAASRAVVTLHLVKGLHPLMVEHYSRTCDDGAIRIRWSGGGIPADTVLAAPYLRKR